MQTLQGALLSCTYTVLDYAQTGLIAAVFFFKVRWLSLLIFFASFIEYLQYAKNYTKISEILA